MRVLSTIVMSFNFDFTEKSFCHNRKQVCTKSYSLTIFRLSRFALENENARLKEGQRYLVDLFSTITLRPCPH